MLHMFAWLLQSGTELTDKFQDIKIKKKKKSKLGTQLCRTMDGNGNGWSVHGGRDYIMPYQTLFGDSESVGYVTC